MSINVDVSLTFLSTPTAPWCYFIQSVGRRQFGTVCLWERWKGS